MLFFELKIQSKNLKHRIPKDRAENRKIELRACLRKEGLE